MKFKIDHDLHIHSNISKCSGDLNQTPERILTYAKENGFHTVSELQEKTLAVFSSNYCESIFAYAFSGFASGTGFYVYARYSSSQAENLRDEDESILVSSTHEPMLVCKTLHDLSVYPIGERRVDINDVKRTVAVFDKSAQIILILIIDDAAMLKQLRLFRICLDDRDRIG